MRELELLLLIGRLIGSVARDVCGGSSPGPGSAARLRGDGGYTTEAVVVIAGLAALAIAVVAIIVTKVTDAANNIPTQ